jgi:hypothetical protein
MRIKLRSLPSSELLGRISNVLRKNVRVETVKRKVFLLITGGTDGDIVTLRRMFDFDFKKID